MLHGTLMQKELSPKIEADSRVSVFSTNGPPKGDSGVDGRLTIIPVTSRLETIGLEVLSSISKCAQKESQAVGH